MNYKTFLINLLLLASLQAAHSEIIMLPPNEPDMYDTLPPDVAQIARQNQWTIGLVEQYKTAQARNLAGAKKDLGAVKATVNIASKALGCCAIICPCWLLSKDCRNNVRVCCGADPEKVLES